MILALHFDFDLIPITQCETYLIKSFEKIWLDYMNMLAPSNDVVQRRVDMFALSINL